MRKEVVNTIGREEKNKRGNARNERPWYIRLQSGGNRC
jgi:hypothetical protein